MPLSTVLENELDMRESLKRVEDQPNSFGGKINPLGQPFWKPIGIKQVVRQLLGTVWEEDDGGHLHFNYFNARDYENLMCAPDISACTQGSLI